MTEGEAPVTRNSDPETTEKFVILSGVENAVENIFEGDSEPLPSAFLACAMRFAATFASAAVAP